jgi:hypothetical protein
MASRSSAQGAAKGRNGAGFNRKGLDQGCLGHVKFRVCCRPGSAHEAMRAGRRQSCWDRSGSGPPQSPAHFRNLGDIDITVAVLQQARADFPNLRGQRADTHAGQGGGIRRRGGTAGGRTGAAFGCRRLGGPGRGELLIFTVKSLLGSSGLSDAPPETLGISVWCGAIA